MTFVAEKAEKPWYKFIYLCFDCLLKRTVLLFIFIFFIFSKLDSLLFFSFLMQHTLWSFFCCMRKKTKELVYVRRDFFVKHRELQSLIVLKDNWEFRCWDYVYFGDWRWFFLISSDLFWNSDNVAEIWDQKESEMCGEDEFDRN